MVRTLAVASIAVLACAASWSQQNPERVSKEAPTVKGQTANEASRQEHTTEQAPLLVRMIESPSDTADRKEREAKTDKHEAEDLDAQVRSANASEKQVLIAMASIVLAGFGTIALIISLRESRRSSHAAIRAADAAEVAVKTAQESARLELRAYVTVDSASIEFPEPAVPRVSVTIRNSGKTPAHEVKHWIHQWIHLYPLQTELPDPPDNFVMGVNVLGPESFTTNTIHHDKPIINDPAYYRIIGTPQGTIYVYGVVTYRDVFDQTHRTEYRLMYGGTGNQLIPGKLAPCPQGNKAT